jgi:hypothetical protein
MPHRAEQNDFVAHEADATEITGRTVRRQEFRTEP